jgi:hypothetical protein
MSDVSDLLTHAVNKSPVEFADAFNDLMQQKARDAIEAHRVTLAQSIYSAADEGDEGDEDDEVEDVTDDDDEFSLDLDEIDLEDLDLEDIDLDDTTDEDTTDEDA